MYIKDNTLIAFYEEDLNTYSDGKGNVILPNDIKEIAYDAFCHVPDKIKTIKAPDVKRVWAYGFKGIKNLTAVDLPSCERINGEAFVDTKLKKINCPYIEYLAPFAFKDCNKLTEIYLPEVTFIGHEAFLGCDELKTVYMPNVRKIGKGAFVSCKKIEEVKMPVRKNVVLGGRIFDKKIQDKFIKNDIELEL